MVGREDKRASVRWRAALRAGLVAALLPSSLALAVGCAVPEDRDLDRLPDEVPGSDPYNTDTNVSCTTSDECAGGETCEQGVCMMARCVDSYDSQAPLGIQHFFGTDGEVAIISDGSYVDAYEGSDGAYMSSWNLTAEGGNVVDVAGGNMLGTQPQAIAVAIEFSDKVIVRGPDGLFDLDIGLWPKAIDVGDVDNDGIEELVAFSEDGTISVCNVDTRTCSGAKIDDVTGLDVAVGDVDRDGFSEPVFLLDMGGQVQMLVWNQDADITGQEATLGWNVNIKAHSFSSGDLDGDGFSELVLLEDGGWWGWNDDKLHVFSPAQDAIVATTNVNGRTKDVAVGDRNSDDADEIAILRDGQIFELFSASDGNITSLGSAPVGVGGTSTRLSMVDWNGDSATGKLVDGPELVAGDAVPIAVLMFPPYAAKLAVGALAAKITVGQVENTSESTTDTLSLGVGIGVSFGAEAGPFKAKVGAEFGKNWKYSRTLSKFVSIGARYSVHANPELFGVDYAAVILSCGCYHRYRYETLDPNNLIGGTGQTMDVFIPVGGQTQLWSSKRYNAMAKKSGRAPVIDVPIRVGDVSSYPNEMLTLGGQPVAEEDMVFTDVPDFQVSDVGYVSFRMKVGESESNSEATTTTVGAKTSFGLFGNGIDANFNLGVGQGYSVNVGAESFFSGGVPPIPDDPNTPEDEFLLNRYSFTPNIHRQKYVNHNDEEASYYVMYFAVGD